jgi:5-formyltetrahydrofolate cyclo-ligase
MKERKNNLRRTICENLAALTPVDVHAKSQRVCHRLAEVPGWRTAEWICAFVSFGTEVHTHDLIRGLLAERKRVCVPSFDSVGQRYLCSEVKHFDADLRAGLMGIMEPNPQAVRPVHVELLEAWLVPGVAFDRNGNRLGRGMGYYDGLLRNAHGLKVALTYDFQLVNEVPAEAHDVPMDFIVTENQVVHCQRK